MVSLHQIFERIAVIAELGIEQTDQQVRIHFEGICELHPPI